MGKRLRDYLQLMKDLSVLWEKEGEEGLTLQEKEQQKEDLMIQIGFFQHERLVHLIVTVTFAILTFMAVGGALFMPEPAMFILILFLLILLVPYIRHYYLLENGVQELYTYYDRLWASILRDKHRK